ncbi:MAG: hypothetical protein WCT52_01205 [Candidatus Micrarchaeia archaeon]
MPSIRAQASVETITVFGISMLIVLAFMVSGLNMMSDSSRLQQENDAYNSAHDLATAADEVYSQGEGASKTVLIKLPASTVFDTNLTYIGKPENQSSNASAESRIVMINYGTGETNALANEPISGSFPSARGNYRMKVVSRGNYVAIYPSLVEISQYSVHASMAQNETRQYELDFYRISGEQVNVTITSGWAFSDVNCTVSSSAFSPEPGGTTITVSISASSTASGFYSSTLHVNATATSGATETILLPVNVDVQGG